MYLCHVTVIKFAYRVVSESNGSVQQMYTPVYHYSRKGLLRNRKFIIAYKIKGNRNA